MIGQRYHYDHHQRRRLRLLHEDDDTNDHDGNSNNNQNLPPASEPILLQILEGMLVLRIIITILCVINNTSLRPFQYYLEIINNIGWIIVCALCIRRLLAVRYYYYYYNKNHHHHHHQWWWWLTTIDRPIVSTIHDVLGARNSTSGDDTWKDQVRNFMTSCFSSVMSVAQQSKMNIFDFLQNYSKFDGPHNDLNSDGGRQSRNTGSEFLETIRTWFRDRYNRAWDFRYSTVQRQEYYYYDDTSTKEDRTSLLTSSSFTKIESSRHNSATTINAPSRMDLDRGMEIEMVNSHIMMDSSSNLGGATRIHGNSRKDL